MRVLSLVYASYLFKRKASFILAFYIINHLFPMKFIIFSHSNSVRCNDSNAKNLRTLFQLDVDFPQKFHCNTLGRKCISYSLLPVLPDQLLFHKFLLLNNHFLTLFEFAEMFRCIFQLK